MTLMPTNNQNPYSSILDTPEMRKQMAWDMLGGLGMGLIQAGAPSPYPQSPFGAFGMAMQGAQGAMNEDKYLKRAMVGMQAAKIKSDLENDKAWADAFKAPANASVAGVAGPQQASVPTGAPFSMPPEQAKATAQQYTKYLVDNHGMTPEQATAMVGNLYQESGFNPTAVHDNGTGFGMGGWRLERRDALLNAAKQAGKDPRDPQFQLDFYANELKGRPEFAQFQAAQTPQDRQTALMTYFRPAGWTPQNPQAGNGFGNRVQFAQTFAGGPQIEQGGGEGQPMPQPPVQLAQNGNAPTLPPQQAYRPQTMQDVIQSMPPGVRQMVGAMGRKEGMGIVMKYADPGSEAVYDTQSGSVVFVPKTMVGRDPRYQPVKGEELRIAREREQREAANQEVRIDPATGQPVVNAPLVQAKKEISAAQGTDPSGQITKELAQDAIKRNSDWQKNSVSAQSTISNLDTFNKLAENVKQGRFQGTATDIKAALKGTGINLEALGIPDNVGAAQAIQMMSQRFALEMRQEMPGPMSDGDRKFMEAGSLSLEKDPGANAVMAEWIRGNSQRSIDRAKFANEYIRSQAFKTDPAGIDEYVNGKLAGKSYFNADVLPKAPAGNKPPLESFGGGGAPAAAPGNRPPLSNFGGGR